MSESQPNRSLGRWALRFVLIAAVLVYAALWFGGRPLASVPLADGTILHIQQVAYGTNLHIGHGDYFRGFFDWLPFHLGRITKGSTLNMVDPALVVWVDATDAKTGKNVDCQKIQVEFMDRHGELWGEHSRSWYGFRSGYSRLAHIFRCFPRDERTLTMRIKPWKRSAYSQVEFKNPCYTVPAIWTGQPLPQRQETNGLEIFLDHLSLATNQDWGTSVRFWDPSWQMRRGGVPIAGWDDPEWEAEDPLGNRGQTPNVFQPVLRYSAAFYLSATNLEAAIFMAALPKVDLTSTATNFWNITNHFPSGGIALGCFPPGTYIFIDGQFTNYNPGLRPVGGGALSGWVAQSRVVRGRREIFQGHYTPSPVIYLRYKEVEANGRLAMRFRDDHGACWIAPPEQGERDYIHPFMLPPPPGVKWVTPEIVLLKPVKATFLVTTPKTP